MLSHRNMVAGAKSVAGYLENHADDVLLAALPLSFDAGFSQLTTAFHVGARVVLLNYLLPKDVLKAVVERARHRADRRAAAVDPADAAAVAATVDRASALLCQHRRAHAAGDAQAPARGVAEGQALPDVRPDRGISRHLSSARGGRPAPGFDRQGDPERRDPRAARGRHALRAQRAGRTRAARCAGRHGLLERSARRPPSAFGRCPGASRGWCCPRSRCSPATPCGGTRRASCTSSAAATR